jgi:hypothetical protein
MQSIDQLKKQNQKLTVIAKIKVIVIAKNNRMLPAFHTKYEIIPFFIINNRASLNLTKDDKLLVFHGLQRTHEQN